MRKLIRSIPTDQTRCPITACVYNELGWCDNPQINKGNSDAACHAMRNGRLLDRLQGPTREPTEFEMKVMRLIQIQGLLAGDRQVAISAACRRLERMGYAMKPGTHWSLTEKGRQYMKENWKVGQR